MVARLAKLSLKGRFGISDSDLGAILRFIPPFVRHSACHSDLCPPYL